ncbi:oligopeptide/dipeptide ABC transporter ATP-binding protein [Dactylosporangium sp. NPDC000555]|uniref:ABC transporter ATP-binding protein n=1 Tax=Dactylosporangium sp. NPDC000555 TaxID=3154260 RepID=UPI00332F837A
MTAHDTDETAVLEVRDLEVRFPVRHGLLRRPASWVYAVNDVSIDLYRGETLGLVGESGSGKTTVGRAMVRVNQPSNGTIRLDGQDLLALHGTRLRPYRRRVQMVFQDPYASLDPRQSVGQALAEPLRVHGLAAGRRAARVSELLELVGLDPSFAARYPHQFSGGQRQRIGIARALAVEPDIIVCDEPVSALDVSVQAQVVNLLASLQRQLGIAYLFIAHDLAVVRHLAHRVAVMYLGSIVETGPSEAVYSDPRHPYTAALLSAVPALVEKTRQRTILRGDIPSPENPPTGCLFHTRCPLRDMLGSPEVCSTQRPPLRALAPGHHRTTHQVACHFADDPRARRTAADVAGSLTADQPR